MKRDGVPGKGGSPFRHRGGECVDRAVSGGRVRALGRGIGGMGSRARCHWSRFQCHWKERALLMQEEGAAADVCARLYADRRGPFLLHLHPERCHVNKRKRDPMGLAHLG